jgi:hypothetical protein
LEENERIQNAMRSLEMEKMLKQHKKEQYKSDIEQVLQMKQQKNDQNRSINQ